AYLRRTDGAPHRLPAGNPACANRTLHECGGGCFPHDSCRHAGENDRLPSPASDGHTGELAGGSLPPSADCPGRPGSEPVRPAGTLKTLDSNSPAAPGAVRLESGTVRIDGATLLAGVDFALAPHTVTGLIGPNGAGKSTLLKVLGRQQALSSGKLYLDDRPYAAVRSRDFARRVAYLPQTIPATPGLTVDEFVCL